jgi:hypothetical protein
VYVDACESALSGNASPGTPAAGTPLKDLCYRTLHCIRETNCAKNDPVECYCGAGTAPTACIGGATGLCRDQIRAGYDYGAPDPTNPSATIGDAFILGSFGDATYAAGVSVGRALCDQANCNSTCFH